MTFTNVYGVDFSGAKLAGHNTWIAHATAAGASGRRLGIRSLHPLTHYSGTPDRDPALAHLVHMVRASEDAVWGFDFPFALPIEVADEGARFPDQLSWVRDWGKDAYSFGVQCLNRAQKLKREWHIRRTTDSETKAPFDCYHYRIIYQT